MSHLAEANSKRSSLLHITHYRIQLATEVIGVYSVHSFKIKDILHLPRKENLHYQIAINHNLSW